MNVACFCYQASWTKDWQEWMLLSKHARKLQAGVALQLQVRTSMLCTWLLLLRLVPMGTVGLHQGLVATVTWGGEAAAAKLCWGNTRALVTFPIPFFTH